MDSYVALAGDDVDMGSFPREEDVGKVYFMFRLGAVPIGCGRAGRPISRVYNMPVGIASPMLPGFPMPGAAGFRGDGWSWGRWRGSACRLFPASPIRSARRLRHSLSLGFNQVLITAISTNHSPGVAFTACLPSHRMATPPPAPPRRGEGCSARRAALQAARVTDAQASFDAAGDASSAWRLPVPGTADRAFSG